MEHLRRIKAGEISLQFRKWKKPSAKAESLIHTRVGQLKVESVDVVERSAISEQEAKQSGFDSLEDLLKVLDKRKEETIYKIALSYVGEDPRIALRNKAELTDNDFQEIKGKLERFDKFSKQGDWTVKVLQTIKENPEVLAQILADKLGYEKAWFKPNVRKLKNLGLTISHGVGYSLSPRGKEVLKRLTQ